MSAWQRLVRPFALDPDESLPVRVYNTATLLGTSISLLLLVPGNLYFGLDPMLTALAAGFGLSCSGLYLLSRRRRQLPGTLAWLFGALLNASWFLGGGSMGSVGMWFFTASVLMAILLRGRTRVLALGLLLLDGLLLHWIEIRHPALIAGAGSAGERFTDLMTGFTLSLLACVLLVGGVLGAYNREQRRLEEANLALERSLAEVKALRGLLPVCAWCQRIRDDAGGWRSVADYVAERTGASITHGICPDCLEMHFDQR